MDKNFFIPFIFFSLFFLAHNSYAATLNCDGSQSDCQDKVDAALDGDTLNIPAGTFDWGSAYIYILNENITVMGAGQDQTIIRGSARGFVAGINPKAGFRISNMTLDIPGPGAAQSIWLDYADYATKLMPAYGWRIDHIKFDGDVGTNIFVLGNTWGLIDHCTFPSVSGIRIAIDATMPYAGEACSGCYDLSLPMELTPSTQNAVYVEDCNFSFTNINLPSVFDLEGGGGRIVFRHNTVTDGFLYNHWNRGGHISGTKWEVYGNTFIGSSWAASGGMPARFQAGTGVIYNNTVTGYSLGWKVDELRGCGQESSSWLLACDGTHAWDGNLESNGWPCLNQIGRATGITLDPVTHAKSNVQASQPAYAWNNGTQATCATGGKCTDSVTISRYNSCPTNVIQSAAHSNGDFDYINNGSTPMPGYAPFVYPHPLQGSDDTMSPAAPTGLSVN